MLQNAKKLDQLFSKADFDRNDELNVEEFMNMVWTLRAEEAEKQALKKVFENLDADQSGALSPKELKRAVTLNTHKIIPLLADFPILKDTILNPKKLTKVFEGADIDQNKEIDFPEFYNYVFVLRRDFAFNKCLQDVFDFIDADSGQSLTRRELQNALILHADSIKPMLQDFPEISGVLMKPSKVMRFLKRQMTIIAAKLMSMNLSL